MMPIFSIFIISFAKHKVHSANSILDHRDITSLSLNKRFVNSVPILSYIYIFKFSVFLFLRHDTILFIPDTAMKF